MNAHANLESGHHSHRVRKPKRLPVALDLALRTPEGEVVAARLVNVSRRGFGLECATLVMIGSVVEVELPGPGWVRASVRWSLGGRIGGWFLQEIDADVCAALFEAGGAKP